jgi:hypothetical protein
MEAAEICPLNRRALNELLAVRDAASPDCDDKRRRKVKRWPFPGTVELWVPDEMGLEHYSLATSLDLSLDGVGIQCDEELPRGLELAVALHEPEVSFHGRAVVRHCTEIEGDYLIGLQFVFGAR